MNTKLPKLKIYMLGGLNAVYGDTPIVLGRNTSTRSMRLLRLLVYYGEKGISREDIFKELFRYEEVADMANNLRVTVHRVKKLLNDVGLPEGEYIVVKQGIYYWNPPMETEIDAKEFEKKYQQAEIVEDVEQKTVILQEVCRMYKGEFLANYSGEEWVVHEAAHYKKIYTAALTQLCEILMKNGEYEKTLEYCAPACEMYPFDEWQSVKIDCYMSLNRYKEAMKEYEDTARLFFEELGISPSEKMMEQFYQMSNRMDYKPQAIREIKSRLREDEKEDGAFYCSLPSFRDSYRLLSRVIERSGQSAYIMLCSLMDTKGQPMEKDAHLDKMVEVLDQAICKSLRRGDCYTRFSPSQFLVLIVGANKEDCGRIFDRIRSTFSKNHKSWGSRLEYFISFITEIEKDSPKIHFGGQNTWKM